MRGYGIEQIYEEHIKDVELLRVDLLDWQEEGAESILGKQEEVIGKGFLFERLSTGEMVLFTLWVLFHPFFS